MALLRHGEVREMSAHGPEAAIAEDGPFMNTRSSPAFVAAVDAEDELGEIGAAAEQESSARIDNMESTRVTQTEVWVV